MPRKRLDLVVVERGLVESRSRAQALILAGQVAVNGEPRTKAGELVDESAEIRLKGEDHPYVSRGGLKLEAALKAFQVSVSDKVGADIGASTGGFTDVLLQNGARRVFAIDVGKNQLAWKIRSDPRVVVFEGINVRYLDPAKIGTKVDVITIDLSFISLKQVLEPLLSIAHPETDWIALIKPQFEVGKGKVGKGGIVRSEEDRQEAARSVIEFSEGLGLIRQGLIDSPIRGTHGNLEFLVHWKTRHR